MKEYGLVRQPKFPQLDKKLLPKYPKRVKQPRYYKKRMKQLKRELL